ncbi:MAG: PIG-L family deacetylase, partial [Armatimonadetes bacterium]|nr:PIG-L family deacetylase [Armatimonadota bacterium]
IMTNGDASELALIFGDKDLPLGPKAFISLGKRRQRESLEALKLLGVPEYYVHFLSYPNNGLLALWKADHWLSSTPYSSPYTRADHSPYERSFTSGAVYCGQQVTADLLGLLDEVRPTKVFVTHPQDLHPDHWATAAFVRYALALLRRQGQPWAERIQLYGYLIHWPRWPLPRAWTPKLALAPPQDLVEIGGGAWLKLPLDPATERQKTRALRCYRSQEPSSDRLLLAFLRTNEAFCRLTPAELVPGKSASWRDETTTQGKLGGADVRFAYVRVGRDGFLIASLLCAPHPLPKKGYLAVDVRTWDATGCPTFATLYITQSGQSQAALVRAGRLSTFAFPTKQTEPGLWTLGPVALPPSVQDYRDSLVLCWGSRRDRSLDPAPWLGE